MASSAETQSLKGPGLAAALAAAATAFTGGAALPAFLTTFALSYGLQAWSMREARKRAMEDVADRKVTIRSAIAPFRVVYGEAVVSGPMIYAQVTGTDKEYLHLIVALAGHRVHSFGDIWLDDVQVGTLDGSGNVTSGDFAGLARLQFVAGTNPQSAFSDLVSESGGTWTTDHKGTGIAAVYARLKWDQDKFPGGIPQIRVLVRGAMCYDPRTAASALTHNPALILRDYLIAARGLGCDSSEIDDASVITAANVCDGWVALASGTSISVTADPAADTFTTSAVESRIQTGDRCVLSGTAPTGLTSGSTYYIIRRGPATFQLAADYSYAIEGTPIGFAGTGSGLSFGTIEQRRYTACGTFTRDMTPKDVIEDLLKSMAGSLVWTAGQWRMTAGAYVAPTVTLTADDLRGPVTFRNRVPRSELTNQVRGSYVEPSRGWVVTEFAPVTDAAFVTEDDGENIERSVDQPWVTSAFRGQRLAKITLLKSRAKRLSMPCKITALPLVAADTVSVTLAQLGLSSAAYRIIGWKLTGDDGGLGVDLELEEESADHYDWDPADGVDPPINNTPELPSQLTVVAPASMSIASGTSELLLAGDGTIISRMRVTWPAAAEPSVTGYEVQWKRDAESTYNSVTLPRDGLQYYIGPVIDGELYQVRLRTLAAPMRRSAWVPNAHTVVGKTAAPTAPTSIGITQLPNALQISWTTCPDADYRETEVWEASTNDRSGATQVAALAGTALTRSGFAAAAVRYYWVRHVDSSGNVSSWYPSSATGGVSGTAGADPGNEITHDFTGFLAGGASGYLSGAGYWLGYAGGAYKMHLGNPSGQHIKWDGTNFTVVGGVVAGALTVNSSGSIAIGATDYLTGSGFWAGYSSSAYKWHFGDPGGQHIKWDGSALTIKGGLVAGDLQVDAGGNIRGGQTAYNTGVGFWIGKDGSTYKLSLGDPTGSYMRWTGTAFEASGAIVDTRPFVAGSYLVAASWTPTGMPLPSGTYALLKAIKVPRAGTIRVGWSIAGGGGTCKTRVYVSGVAVGAEHTTTGTNIDSWSDDVTVAAADTVEIWGWWSSASGTVYDLTLSNAWNENQFVVVQETI